MERKSTNLFGLTITAFSFFFLTAFGSAAFAGSISGQVTSGVAPVASVCVTAFDNLCYQHANSYTGQTDAAGNYTIPGLPEGTYYLNTHASCVSPQNYVDEWWDSGEGTFDCNQAAPVAVTAGGDMPNINFALEPGGSVSGNVSDALGNPIPNLPVFAETAGCGGQWLSGTNTDENGNYALTGLPAGNVFIRTCAHCNGQNYVDEWYDNAIGCNQAIPVLVVAGQDRPGINFSLEPGGSISGRVTDATGAGIPNLNVFADGNQCGGNWLASTNTDPDGYYTLTGLPGGNVYVATCAQCSGLPYINEWYDGKIDCNQANPVLVVVGQDTPGINFSLEPGGSISGRVTDAGGDGIPDLNVQANSSQCGGGLWLGATNTDPNGYYTLTGLPGGNAYVATCAQCSGLPYINEWYDGKIDCNQANPVPVVAGQDMPGINFLLEEGGNITGHVSDPWGNPVPFVPVSAFTGLCYANWTGGTQTDQNGNYSIPGLPFGDYYVVAQARCNTSSNLHDGWWNGGTGTPDCNLAVPVNVTGPISGIDFFLSGGTPYPAPFFNKAEMFSLRNPDGSMGTVFYAFVGGPSPEDVCSFTVSGPAGTFDLQPTLSFRQHGLIYLRSLNFVAPNGMYTFWLTDTMGRSVSVTRNFVFNDVVPQIDPGTMYPLPESYVGTTPILGANPPVVIAAPVVPGPLQYQVMVRDYHSSAIWYASDYLDYPTFQVPEGLLQPNTPYFWFIRVIDKGTEGRNRTESRWFSFFTGASSAPLLENPAVLSMTVPPYGPDKAYWLGVMSRNTAPWDVEYLQVRDEFGGVYDWTGRIDYWFTHPCLYSWFFWSDTSIPDGAYTFEMQDWNTNTGTATRPYAYSPVPPVSEDTMYPNPNAYLGIQPLTFSWAPLVTGDTSYLYRLRIRDFNQRIVWYDSAWGSETSVTVPEWLNLPRGSSYKWQVMTMDAGGSNLAYTRPRTFTLNPFRFPKPEVKVNGQDGPVFLPSPGLVDVEVSLNPGDMTGEPMEWWIGVLSSIGNYWFAPSLNWVPSNTPISVGQIGLFDLAPYPVLMYDLPTGIYTFFFVLDKNANGVLDELTWYDYVNVFISPDGMEMESASHSDEAFLNKIKALIK